MKKSDRIGLFGILLCLSVLLMGTYVYAEEVQPTEKKVVEISAEYNKKEKLNRNQEILVGTPLELEDFSIERQFQNGEKEKIPVDKLAEMCELVEKKIPFEAVGLHLITIKYIGADKEEGKEVKTTVTFRVTNLKLKEIKAKWTGKTKYHVGDSINKKEVHVDGVYDTIDKKGNHIESSQSIHLDFVTFEPETITVDGDNYIKVKYLNFETTFKIRGYDVKSLKVEYTGPKTIVVGQEIDRKKIKVSKIFSSGEVEKVEDYNIDSTEVKVVGPNVFIISHGTFSERLTITGVQKLPQKIEAKYEGGDLVVGDLIDTNKILVNVIYNDKTKEVVTSGFEIKPNKVIAVGVNEIQVTYKGLSDTIKIKAAEYLPSSIFAVYNGGMVIEGSLVKKKEIVVTAYYSDGSSKTVTDFELSTETVNTIGMQEIIVNYKGATAIIYVPVTAKMVTSIEVSYKGAALTQYSSIDRNDIVVTARYNDGTSANVTDYTMATTVASKVGKNVFTIFYGGKSKDLVVEALAKLILGRGTLKADVSGENYGTSLTAYIENQFVRDDIKLEVEPLETEVIKKAVRRVNKTKKFVAFEVSVDSFQFDENQYMITEAIIPEGFNPAKVGVFYTPDRNKVMVQLTGGLVSSSVYRFYVYTSGTYVLMETEESDVGRQELREEEYRTPFLIASVPEKIEIKDKPKIKAFLLFANFENTEFIYESDNEDVLTVSKDGVITAKKTGTASITVRSAVGGYSQSYEVEVTK